MSPRSEEFLASARERLASARDLLLTGHSETSAGAAYYAMLYAARAALSEQDLNAKTHRGTWHLFRDSFVASGRFEPGLYEASQEAQRLREAADYEAGGAAPEEAERVVAAAERFVATVESVLEA